MRREFRLLLRRSGVPCLVLLFVMGAVFLPIGRAEAAFQLVDHFTDPQGPIIASSVLTPAPNVVTVGGASILGQNRWLTVTWLAGVNQVSSQVQNVSGGTISFNNGSGTNGNLTITYNGSPASVGNFALAQNFVTMGVTSLNLYVFSTDFGVNNAHARLYTDATHYSDATFNIPGCINVPVSGVCPAPLPQNYEIPLPLAFFSTPGPDGAVNLTQVNKIEIFLPGIADLDLTLQDIQLGENSVSCVSKTINGSQNLIITSVPQTVTVSVTVQSDATSESAQAIAIQDTLTPSDGTWYYVNNSTVVDSGPDILPANPTGAPNGPLVWDSTGIGTLNPGQQLTFHFELQVDDLAPSATKTNAIAVRLSSQTEFPSPGSQCTAQITLRQEQRVPSLNEWGMIILSLILAASAVWLVRRRRTS